mmetsp:Transcript_40583/g.87914  ORF Transcript_40583/g.87914 Transcript_40583/m.87914 type:complete len:257 (-) Transcript_40583:612-1382(-)
MKNLKQPWLGNMRFSRFGFDALHLGPHLGIMNSCHLLQEENQRIKFVGMSQLFFHIFEGLLLGLGRLGCSSNILQPPFLRSPSFCSLETWSCEFLHESFFQFLPVLRLCMLWIKENLHCFTQDHATQRFCESQGRHGRGSLGLICFFRWYFHSFHCFLCSVLLKGSFQSRVHRHQRWVHSTKGLLQSFPANSLVSHGIRFLGRAILSILGIVFLPLHVDCFDGLLDDTQADHDRIHDALAASRQMVLRHCVRRTLR